MCKIVVLAETAHPACIGGIETFERVLKNFFREKITFIAYPTAKKKIFTVENIEEVFSLNIFFRILNKLFNNKIKYYFVKKKIRKLNPDICILRMPYNIDFIDNNKIKTILVQHSAFEVYKDYHFKQGNNLLEKLKEKLDCFIFLSKYDQEKFVKELNFPIEKTRVIRHTSSIELLKEKKNKNKRLIMIGRISNKEKRFDLVVKAMKKLSDFSLNIYGDGEDKEFLADIIKKNNLKNVFLYDAVSNVQEELDKASILICSSELEAYGIVNIEAMRRGLPIILRNSFTSAQDIIQGNGILLEKEWNEQEFLNAVHIIYKNYEEYSEKSCKLGIRYNHEIIKKEWKDLISELKGESL